MRVLEARFHPHQGSHDDFIVVAHVVWDGNADTEAAPRVRDVLATPSPMLAKLRFLVDSTTPETFVRLQRLKSRFWSFVEVTSPE